MKQCSACGKILSKSNFGPRKLNKDGLSGQCRNCRNAKRIKREAGRKEQLLKQGRENYFKSAYGLTFEDRAKIYVNQNGRCDICQDPVPLDKIAIDHDHKTGKIRALLCYSCNRNLAGVENKEFLKKALEYLKKHESARNKSVI